MSEYRLQDVVRSNRLREAYGEEIELTEDGRDAAVTKTIVLEFDIGGRSYVVLRPADVITEDPSELSLFRIRDLGDGEFEIESIDDDDEWEDISELVDEMTTRFSDEM